MDAISEMYARWAAGDMGMDDQWGDVTAEPRGLDYAEVSAGGVPAMWLVPHGAVLDAASPRARALLAGYMAAWEASDAGTFRDVLRADAAIVPVGSPTSYAGRAACLAFATPSMGDPGDWRMVATEANGQPAALAWFRGEPFGLAVLTAAEDGIVAVTLFGDPKLAEIFLPVP